jgi:hypothetical protein
LSKVLPVAADIIDPSVADEIQPPPRTPADRRRYCRRASEMPSATANGSILRAAEQDAAGRSAMPAVSPDVNVIKVKSRRAYCRRLRSPAGHRQQVGALSCRPAGLYR